jgi:hypothetical protein
MPIQIKKFAGELGVTVMHVKDCLRESVSQPTATTAAPRSASIATRSLRCDACGHVTEFPTDELRHHGLLEDIKDEIARRLAAKGDLIPS